MNRNPGFWCGKLHQNSENYDAIFAPTQVLLNISLYNGCRHSTTQLRPHSTLFAFRPPMTARDFFHFTIKVNGRLKICSHPKMAIDFSTFTEALFTGIESRQFFDPKLFTQSKIEFCEIEKEFILSRLDTKKKLSNIIQLIKFRSPPLTSG